MNYDKRVRNHRQLKKLKIASIKFKESMLDYQIKKGYDDKTITQTRNEIQQLKNELKK